MLIDYYIVNKKILPDIYGKVMEVKKLLQNGECKNTSEAIDQVGISRSAFYKYKDYIFEPSQHALERKAVLSFNLQNKVGLLSRVLQSFSDLNCSVLTINQNFPVHNQASVVVCLDISNLNHEVKDLLNVIEEVVDVSDVQLISIE